MPNSLADIIAELERIDPSFRAQSDRLRPALEQLLRHQPQPIINQAFIQQLRTTLMTTPEPASRPLLSRWWPALAVAVIATVALIVYPYLRATGPSTIIDGGVKITSAHQQAFGALTSTNITSTRSALATTTGTQSTSNAGFGAPSTPVNGEVAKDMVLPSPIGVDTYRYPVYHYTGNIIIPTGDVLKRTKTLAGLTADSSIGLLNLGSFSGLHADQVTWSQRTADGYTISVDAKEGVVSISRDYSTTNTVTTPTATGSGSVGSATGSVARDTNAAQAAPALSNAAAITIANNFLRDHGISITGYAQPVVQEQMSGPMPLEKSVASGYAPSSTISIVYPLVINNLVVYDESGNEFGLQVMVDAGTKSVANVYNLMTRTYTASNYQVTKQVSTIREYLGRGGWLWGAVSTDTKTVDITPGAPTSVLMLSRYQLANNQDDLLIPALRFPLSTADQATTGRRAVVVPVLDQLLTPPAVSETKPQPAADTVTSTKNAP